MNKAVKTPGQWLDNDPKMIDWLNGYITRNPCKGVMLLPPSSHERLVDYLEKSLKSRDSSYLQRAKQAWRVHQSREGKNLKQAHLHQSKRDIKVLETLAKKGGNGRTSVSAVVAELIRLALKDEEKKKATIKEAKEEAKRQILDQQQSNCPFIPLVTAKEAQTLRDSIAAKDQEIQALNKQLAELSTTPPPPEPQGDGDTRTPMGEDVSQPTTSPPWRGSKGSLF